MYQYSEFDKAFLQERVAQYRDQVSRRLTGALTEDEFKPLRLMNGVYLQLHAYMLRVAIPYGTLSAAQMRGLADIAERWDKGYGHFTTRQSVTAGLPVSWQTFCSGRFGQSTIKGNATVPSLGSNRPKSRAT